MAAHPVRALKLSPRYFSDEPAGDSRSTSRPLHTEQKNNSSHRQRPVAGITGPSAANEGFTGLRKGTALPCARSPPLAHSSDGLSLPESLALGLRSACDSAQIERSSAHRAAHTEGTSHHSSSSAAPELVPQRRLVEPIHEECRAHRIRSYSSRDRDCSRMGQ